MVASTYATQERRGNTHVHSPRQHRNTPIDLRTPSPGRAKLLELLSSTDDTIDIDVVLDALRHRCLDPYAEIVAAVKNGCCVAEFAAAPAGSTLRSIVLRRL